MIKKFLTFSLLLFLFSCANQNITSFGTESSNINNLSFRDIKNIKEYKSCSKTSGKSAVNDSGVNSRFLRFYLWPLLLIPSSNIDIEYESASEALISGDSSISSAVKLGGIGKIKMIDHSYEITGLFERQFCVIVYGE